MSRNPQFFANFKTGANGIVRAFLFMGKDILKFISQTIGTLLDNEAKSAVKYINDKFTIRASRKTFKGKIVKGNIEISLVIGKPNYEAREFIKLCKKAKEKFPIKKIQLKFLKRKGRD